MIRLAVLFAKSKWIGRFENMKKIACIIFIQIALSSLWALDYRQVLFSNNYERIEKVTDKESILGNSYNAIISAVKKKVDNAPCVLYEYPNFKYNELYAEKYENGKVYRLLIADEPLTTDKIVNMTFKYIGQVTFLKEQNDLYIIDYSFLHYRDDHDGMFASSKVDVYEGMEVINRNNRIKGIMKHKSEVEVRTHTNEDTGSHWIENKGFSNANYYKWKDLQNPKKYTLVKDNIYLFDGCHNHIEIKSTRPLIDKKRPLMYTIQNAFDGNPATAYVEDTDDDLFSISINDVRTKDPKKEEITKIKIINGYSSSENFYVFNNRIKSISHYNWKTKANDILAVKDTPFIFQEIDYISGACNFEVKELYKGSKYSDTCLSEVDFYYKKFGWLFRN